MSFRHFEIARSITSELKGEKYADCRALTDKAAQTDIEAVIDELRDETDDIVREYYGMFLNLIAEKNPEIFDELKGESDMKYPALMKVFENEVNAKIEEKVKTTEQETTVSLIGNVMKNMGLSIIQAMDRWEYPGTSVKLTQDLWRSACEPCVTICIRIGGRQRHGSAVFRVYK